MNQPGQFLTSLFPRRLWSRPQTCWDQLSVASCQRFELINHIKSHSKKLHNKFSTGFCSRWEGQWAFGLDWGWSSFFNSLLLVQLFSRMQRIRRREVIHKKYIHTIGQRPWQPCLLPFYVSSCKVMKGNFSMHFRYTEMVMSVNWLLGFLVLGQFLHFCQNVAGHAVNAPGFHCNNAFVNF